MDTIRAARKARGLTQVELAEQLGVSQSTVAGWESGRRTVELARLYDVCSALGLKPHEVHPAIRPQTDTSAA